MAWIAMLFLLLAVEYRATDKDKSKSAHELTVEFGNLAKQANENLKNILNDEHASFADLLKAQQDSFTLTLKTIVGAQRQDERKFAALLKRQQGLFEQQQEMIESLNGHLLPGNDPMPVNRCTDLHPMSTNDYLFLTPFSTDIVELPFVVLRVHKQDMITVSKGASGLLELRMNIRNRDGSLIVRFDEDGFEVSPALYKRHPDKSTLVVEDSFGNEVLRVRYKNQKTLYLRGKINIDGRFVDIPFAGFGVSDLCSFHSHVAFNIN
jgi:hypothetical protein